MPARTAFEIRAEMAKVEKERCECTVCDFCDGRGRISRDWDDTYDDSDTCDYCSQGIVDTCARCEALADLDYELNEALCTEIKKAGE